VAAKDKKTTAVASVTNAFNVCCLIYTVVDARL
jgi:hypothetical protein